MRFFRLVWSDGSISFCVAMNKEQAAEKFEEESGDAVDPENVEQVHRFHMTLQKDDNEDTWSATFDDDTQEELVEMHLSACDEESLDEDDEEELSELR